MSTSLHITMVRDLAPPSVPQALQASAASDTEIDLTWSASTDDTGVAGYHVFASGVLVGSPVAPAFAHTGLKGNTPYQYTVSAVDAIGHESAQSSPVSATTPDRTAPAVPTGLSATVISQTQVNLTWNATTDSAANGGAGVGVLGYRLYRNGALLADTPGLLFNNTGLTAATLYSYAVSAYDASSNESAQSAAVAVTTPSAGAVLTLLQGAPVTISGSDFGRKTRPAPLVYDRCDAAPGTIGPAWNSIAANLPANPPPADPFYNMQLRNVGLAPSGWPMGAPDPYVKRFLAGCHLDLSNPYNGVSVGVNFPPPAYPYPAYSDFKEKHNPLTLVNYASDNNWKNMMWSCASTPQPNSGDFFYCNLPARVHPPLSNITNAKQCVVTVPVAVSAAPAKVGDLCAVWGVPGMTAANNQLVPVVATAGGYGNWLMTLDLDTSNMPPITPVVGNILAITKTNPAVVTVDNPDAVCPFNPGDYVSFNGVQGMTQINNDAPSQIVGGPPNNAITGGPGAWNISVLGVDARAYGTFSSGGTMTAAGGFSAPTHNLMLFVQYETDGYQQHGMFQGPNDNNGHTSSYWGNVQLPYAKTLNWARRRWEQMVTNVAGPTGFFNAWDNMYKMMFYAGKTENASSPTIRCMSFGDYHRDRGPPNFRAYAPPIIFDLGETGDVQVPREMLGDAPTYAGCTGLEYQPASAWGNTSITAECNIGAFVPGLTGYLYVCRATTGMPAVADASGIIQTLPAICYAGFDYYIGPTGNDGNAGTLAAPLAITSLIDTNTNNSKLAGKRIGIFPGVYNIAALQSGSANDSQHPVLRVPTGTAANPTYVASCDLTGKFAWGAAVLRYSAAPASTGGNPVIGQNPSDGGYWALDGVEIDGQGFPGLLVALAYSGQGDSATAGNIQGVVIQNCNVHGLGASALGNEQALIALSGTDGAIVFNNMLHDAHKSAQPDHSHAYLENSCQNTRVVFNTIWNADTAICAKAGCSGTVAAYNHIYNCTLCALQGLDGATGSPNLPGQQYCAHHNLIEGCGPATQTYLNPDCQLPFGFYNNTIYDTRNAVKACCNFMFSGNAAINGFYNNILQSTAGQGGAGSAALLMLSQFFFTGPNIDFNCYSFSTVTAGWGMVIKGTRTLFNTLSAWRTASAADSNSISPVAPGFTGGAGGVITPGNDPAQYKLATGSPCINGGHIGNGGGIAAPTCNMGAWDATTPRLGSSYAQFPLT